MIAFFTIIYCLSIWLFFVKMKIKPNPNNVAAAVVIGVLVIGAIVIFWRFAAPNSSNLLVSRFTIPIVPQVKGPVTKIHAEPNVPLRKGADLLLEIQDEIYANTVDQLSASLEAANKDIKQLEAGIRAAESGVDKAIANQAAAKAELDVALNIAKSDAAAIAELQVKQLQEKFKAAQAGVDQARATAKQSVVRKAAAEDTASSIQAQLANAEFNLEQCRIYAPADGFVTAWMVTEGTMAVPMPISQLGAFIDTSRVNIVATFPQNVLRFVQDGDTAELTFKTRPGEVFTGKVETIVQASGEGQFAITANLPVPSEIGSEGMLLVKFILDDPEVAKSLPLGTAGTVAIYTDRLKPFQVISKVVVRMNAWMYYLNPF